MRRPLVLCLVLAACSPGASGRGRVEGAFRVAECTLDTDREFPDFGYEAGFLATRRFERELNIQVFRDPLRIEETDGFILQLGDVRPFVGTSTLASEARPLVLPLGSGAAPVRGILSLLTTCPWTPTLFVGSGTVSFTRLELQPEPEDTGDDEYVKGSVTATLVGPDGRVPQGSLRVSFDFAPDSTPVLIR